MVKWLVFAAAALALVAGIVFMLQQWGEQGSGRLPELPTESAENERVEFRVSGDLVDYSAHCSMEQSGRQRTDEFSGKAPDVRSYTASNISCVVQKRQGDDKALAVELRRGMTVYADGRTSVPFGVVTVSEAK